MRGGARGAALAIVVMAVAIVAAPLAAAAPWLGSGGGPTRAYTSPDPVPSVLEIAFQVELPARIRGNEDHIHEPIILGGHIYAMAVDGVYRVPLATGEVEHFIPIDEADQPHSVVSDGRHLFVETQVGVASYDLDGAVRWEVPFPQVVRGSPRTFCEEPVAAAGALFLHCGQVDMDIPDPPQHPVPPPAPQAPSARFIDDKIFLISYDADTGTERWRVDFPSAGLPGSNPAAAASASEPWPHFLTFVDGVIIAQWWEYASPDSFTLTARRIDAFDAATGAGLWGDERRPAEASLGGQAPEAEYPMSGKAQGPFGVGSSVVTLLDNLQRFDARTGELQWEVPFHEQTHGARFAPVRDGLVVAWAGTIYKMDDAGDVAETIAQLDTSQRMWNGLAASDDWVVGIAHDMRCGPNPAVQKNPDDCYDRWVESAMDHYLRGEGTPGRAQWLHVYGPDDAHWVREFHAIDPDFAVGEGVIVVSEYPRNLTVYGRTAASIGLVAAASDTYPAPGAPVTLDLGATTPGRFDGALEFSVDWGDGTVDGPQASPIFTHSYDSAGDHTALVTANNTAGQSSAERVVFHVGAPRPVEPNLLSKAFSPEWQEYTLFGIGGVFTAAVALFGIIVAKRRRSLLQQELKAIDATRGSADADRLLDAAQTRATMYYRERRLDEAQFAVLREHIDHARNDARLGSLDAVASHLPHGVVLALRQILSDGRVNAWEERHVLSLLPPDTPQHVTEQVREALARWRQHDTQDAWGRA